MKQKPKAYMNWSGGNDSALCLHYLKQQGNYDISHLLTSVNAVHDRISMHGIRRKLLEQQALSIELPLITVDLPEQPGMNEYERIMTGAVEQLRSIGCSHAVFGDIFLEDLRHYREKKLKEQEIQCVFPLWGQSTTELANTFIQLGFKSVVVCVNDKFLDKTFCGRSYDEAFLRDLPDNVDLCGENGEFHSFVFDGPLFRRPVPYTIGEMVYRTYPAPKDEDECFVPTAAADYGFWFCDLLPTS